MLYITDVIAYTEAVTVLFLCAVMPLALLVWIQE